MQGKRVKDIPTAALAVRTARYHTQIDKLHVQAPHLQTYWQMPKEARAGYTRTIEEDSREGQSWKVDGNKGYIRRAAVPNPVGCSLSHFPPPLTFSPLSNLKILPHFPI